MRSLSHIDFFSLSSSFVFIKSVCSLAVRLELEKAIQDEIKNGIAQLIASKFFPTKKNKAKNVTRNATKKHFEFPETEPVGELLLKQKPFYSLLPTITLFLEQEPISGLAMNLDVNYC